MHSLRVDRQPRPRRRTARRGSLIVTVFMVVIGLTLVLGGVNALLKAQMASSLEIKSLAMGRLQAMYLAEMGVNEFMYMANKNQALPLSGTTYDFKANVKMTRDDASARAFCRIDAVGGGNYTATPDLATADGPFTPPWVISFTPTWNPTDRVFVLTSYEVTKQP